MWLYNKPVNVRLKLLLSRIIYVPTFMFYFWYFIELSGERRAIRLLLFLVFLVFAFTSQTCFSSRKVNIKGKKYGNNKNNAR